MDVPGIVKVLRAHLSGGALTLPADVLQSTPVATLFNSYLPGGTLVVTGVADIVDRGTSVLVTGTGGGGPFVGCAVSAVFTAPNAVAQVDLAATTPAGWTWSDGFPALAKTFLPELLFATGGGFRFTSLTDGSGTPGLVYTGTLRLDGGLAVVAWLVGGSTALSLSGPVAVDEGVPLPNLGVTVSQGVDLSLFQLPYVRLGVGATLVPATQNGPAAPRGFVRIDSEVDFTARGTKVTIPLSAAFDNRPSMILLGVDLSALNKEIDSLLGDLAGLLGGSDVSGLLKDVPLSSLLGLKKLLLQIDLAARKLNSVRVVVGSTQPWVILSEKRTRFGAPAALLTVQDIDIALALFDPLGSRQVGAAVFGTLLVGETGKLVGSAVYPGFAFDVELAEGTSIDLTQVIEHFVGQNPDLPALTVVAFDLSVDRTAQSYAGALTVDSDWTIPIGSTTLVVNEVAVALKREGGQTSAHLGGEMTIAGASVTASWDMPGALQLSAALPPVKLTDLIADLSPVPIRSDFPTITLTDTKVYVERRQDGGYYLAAGTMVENFGAFEVEFLDVKGQTGWAFGVVLEENWSVANLSSALAPLSFLKLAQGGLIYATMDDPNFTFRSFTDPTFKFPAQLPSAPPGAKKGLSLYAQLALAGGPLGVIGKVLRGLDGLLLEVTFPANFADAQFRAAYTKPLPLIPGVVVFDDVYVSFTPGQEQFGFHLGATFTVHGTSIKLSGDILVGAGVVLLELRTETQWANPFGIRGLTLEGMGVSIAVGDELTLSLAGKVAIGQGANRVELEAAAEFNTAEEGAPDVLLAKETGTITLAEIVHTFTQTNLPDVLDTISLSDFQFIVVANPNGWTDPLDNKHYQPGLAFGGELRFFGLDARFALQVDYARGVFASGQIDKPLSIHVLTLANATNPATGPYVEVNTANSPYLRLSAALTLFDVVSYVVQAEVDTTGFLFAFKYQITGLGEVDFSVSLKGKTAFALSAGAHFAVKKLGPIKAGKFHLGSLTIDLSLDAHFAIAADTGGNFMLSIGADFTFEGVRLRLDDLTIHQQITSLKELPKLFADNLAALLWDIARSLLQDADALFQLIGLGVVAVGDDIGHILHEELAVPLEKAAALLKSVSAKIGYDARKVAAALKAGFAAADHEVAAALKKAAYAVEDVADAIGHAFNEGAETVAHALKTAGYDLGAVAAALRHAFGYAAQDVAKFFKSAFRAGDAAVNDALKAAGYAADEIKKVMKAVFDWVDHVIDKVKDKLNPKHW